MSLGNDLTESASITLTESTERSLLTSKSFDFAVTGIFKVTSETSVGAAAAFEVSVSAGLDSGWSTGGGVTESLSTGSGLQAIMGNIPHSPPNSSHWLNRERYDWRMFMCKAQLGPLGMLTDVWVQGYVVDNYLGAGGVRELADVALTSPIDSAAVLADPRGTPGTGATVAQCPATPTANAFRFDHPEGSVREYRVEYENVSSGGQTNRVIDLGLGDGGADDPAAFNRKYRLGPDDDTGDPRPSCAVIAPADLVDGDLYRWRTVVKGFLGDAVQSEWEFFRPQVFAPDYTIDVRTPIVNSDGSVTLDIDDPDGVNSLRHEVTILERSADGTETEVSRRQGIRSHHRTVALDPGVYVARVVGYNDHRNADGSRAQTPPDTVTFVVPERLEARFVVRCQSTQCLTTERVAFIDDSLTITGSGIVSWDWDFGDGSSSSEQNPRHIYEKLPPGGGDRYDVTLTVVDAAGRTSSTTKSVRLAESGFARPVAEWTPTGCIRDADPPEPCRATHDPVHFDAGELAPAGRIVTWEWDFGDGMTTTIEHGVNGDVSHAYDRPGVKVVTLTVVDELGQVSLPSTGTIAIENRPATVTVSAPTQVFDDEAATFSAAVHDPDGDSAAATVRWDLPEADPPDATSRTVTATWTTPGLRTVSVTAVDEAGSETTKFLDVRVLAGAIADFTWSCPQRCRWLAPIVFADLSTDEGSTIVAWHWNFGDGTSSAERNPTHRYTRTGTFPVTLTVTDQRGDVATVTKHIRITLL